MSELLSQEEIEYLIGENKEQSQTKEKLFDFSRIEKITKGGFPGLELIFEKWSKSFQEEIRLVFPVINMVSKNKISIMRFSDFIAKVSLPASYTIFTMKPLNEYSLIVVDSKVVFNLVSALFGGGAKPLKIEGRDFTKLEIKLINDFVDIVLKTFEKIWKEIYPVEIEKKSIEFNSFLVRIVSPTEKVIAVELNVEIEGLETTFNFAFPQMLFFPIKDIIYSETFGSELSEEWKEILLKKLSKIKLNVALELSQFTLLARDLLNLEVGNEILLNVKKDDNIILHVGGKPKFYAKLGKLDKKFAAMIIDRIEGESDGRK